MPLFSLEVIRETKDCLEQMWRVIFLWDVF